MNKSACLCRQVGKNNDLSTPYRREAVRTRLKTADFAKIFIEKEEVILAVLR